MVILMNTKTLHEECHTKPISGYLFRSLLMLIVVVSSPAQGKDLSQLVDQTKPAVVHLTIKGAADRAVGNGTGFLVNRRGFVVTNYHVVQPARSITATFSNGRKREVLGLVGADPPNDLAILQIEGTDFSFLSLAEDDSVKYGTPIMVLGSPLGLSWTLSEGIVSAIRDQGLPGSLADDKASAVQLIQITAPISPGSSGSPVLDLGGKVVGVAVLASVSMAQNLNFAVPVSKVRRLMALLPSDAKPKPLYSFPWINLLISAVLLLASLIAWAVIRAKSKRVK